MLVVDSRPLRDRARRMDVTLDVVHADDAALVADLERRLGGRVLHHEVNDVDYVRDTMVVDVRYRAGSAPAQPSLDERRLEVTLDVIHADDAALVADLERRLGGQVLHHQVKDIDYVRDTMVVDVRYQAGSRLTEGSLGRAGHGGAVVNALLLDAPVDSGGARWRHARRAGGGRGRRDGRPDRAGRADGAGRAADPGGPQVLRARRRLPPADRASWPTSCGCSTSTGGAPSATSRSTSTPRSWTTYRAHLQRRRQRFKARTRTYTDSGLSMFEVKLTGAARRDGQATRAAPGRAPRRAHRRGAGPPAHHAVPGLPPGPAGRAAADAGHHLPAHHVRLPHRRGAADLRRRAGLPRRAARGPRHRHPRAGGEQVLGRGAAPPTGSCASWACVRPR